MDGIEDGDAFLEKENEEIDRNEERVESIKATLISALVGTLAGLPISLTQATNSSELILPLTINFISCALFGITFRCTIRSDLDNIQLKTGTSAAFGFRLLLFPSGLDYCFEMKLLSPFPIKKPISR